MYDSVIGVSILTNGSRLGYLKRCISSLVENCYYRPLRISILNNGSTDGTSKWINSLRDSYGIEYRVTDLENDIGCAAGTNAACESVKSEFTLHLESDFELLSPDRSGEDRLWLRRAVEMMQKNKADFLYLRRMVDEKEMMMHWWAQWMPRIIGEEGNYLHCPSFWWSNNPHLHRTEAMYSRGTLPLNAGIDGQKGTANWSQPELQTRQPGDAWIHKWGLFVHELPTHDLSHGKICTKLGKKCKYGFFRDGGGGFCQLCDPKLGYNDMAAHAERFTNGAK